MQGARGQMEFHHSESPNGQHTLRRPVQRLSDDPCLDQSLLSGFQSDLLVLTEMVVLVTRRRPEERVQQALLRTLGRCPSGGIGLESDTGSSRRLWT